MNTANNQIEMFQQEQVIARDLDNKLSVDHEKAIKHGIVDTTKAKIRDMEIEL